MIQEPRPQPQRATVPATVPATKSTSALSRPMVGAHIARNTQPPTQYLGPGRGYSTYYPMLF